MITQVSHNDPVRLFALLMITRERLNDFITYWQLSSLQCGRHVKPCPPGLLGAVLAYSSSAEAEPLVFLARGDFSFTGAAFFLRTACALDLGV
jgi:hypothetical protein